MEPQVQNLDGSIGFGKSTPRFKNPVKNGERKKDLKSKQMD